jgi:hypothetical protein
MKDYKTMSDNEKRLAYRNGDKVIFQPSPDAPVRVHGTICGLISSDDTLTMWIVRLDEKYPGFEYDCFAAPHTRLTAA